MRTRMLGTTILVGGCLMLPMPAAEASSTPPPPPPTPVCGWCSGPPPAPTPVPTLAPTVVAPSEQQVTVEVSPVHVKRGQATKVAVTAPKDDTLTMTVHYSHGKPVTSHLRVGSSGKLVKSWQVPKSAPVGKASVNIEVEGSGKLYSTTVSFVVLK